MFSEELMNFIKEQEKDISTANITENVRKLIESLIDLKKSFSEILSQLFVDNDIDGIQKIIDYGNEIDDFIDELSLLDFSKPVNRKEHEKLEERKQEKRIHDSEKSEYKLKKITVEKKKSEEELKDSEKTDSENAGKYCILCGKPVWKNTDYCKEHMEYANTGNKFAGGVNE